MTEGVRRDWRHDYTSKLPQSGDITNLQDQITAAQNRISCLLGCISDDKGKTCECPWKPPGSVGQTECPRFPTVHSPGSRVTSPKYVRGVSWSDSRTLCTFFVYSSCSLMLLRCPPSRSVTRAASILSTFPFSSAPWRRGSAFRTGSRVRPLDNFGKSRGIRLIGAGTDVAE